jgi:hypothetical protein
VVTEKASRIRRNIVAADGLPANRESISDFAHRGIIE